MNVLVLEFSQTLTANPNESLIHSIAFYWSDICTSAVCLPLILTAISPQWVCCQQGRVLWCGFQPDQSDRIFWLHPHGCNMRKPSGVCLGNVRTFACVKVMASALNPPKRNVKKQSCMCSRRCLHLLFSTCIHFHLLTWNILIRFLPFHVTCYTMNLWKCIGMGILSHVDRMTVFLLRVWYQPSI